MSAKFKFWEVIQKFGGVVGILTSIATLGGFYFQNLNNSLQVEVKVKSIDNLTSFSNFEGLNGVFYYKGKVVSNLFLVKLDFENTGSEVIVGTGKNSNIINDKLPFTFKKGLKVVDGPRQENGTFKLGISTNDSINYYLTFEQWKPGEVVSFSFYFSSYSSNPDFTPIISSRPLVNGSFIVSKSINEKPVEREFFVQYFPSWLVFIIIIALFSLSILVVFGLFSDIAKNQKIKTEIDNWNSQIFPKFLTTVRKNSDLIVQNAKYFKKTKLYQELSLDNRKKLLEDPGWYSKEFWSEFNLPDKPSGVYDKSLARNNLWSVFIVIVVFFILSIPYFKVSWFS